MTTHSSFVANKLGLSSLVLLSEKQSMKLSDLPSSTQAFFEKIPGYDTLRLILCNRAILVEGDSDELVVQKAYLEKNHKLPIEDGVDVISVGTSFIRFLEIAEKLKKLVTVVTDNDGDVEALRKKYSSYSGANTKGNISICFDEEVDEGDLTIGDRKFNYNTLEPKIVKVNGLSKMNAIFGTSYCSVEDLHKWMRVNKTDCALKLFETELSFIFPEYIAKAIKNE